jgi:hypothetical protein
MIKSALFYAANNISVIPTGSTKRAILQWKVYQTRIATPEELKEGFSHDKCSGLAVVCGSVSGGLEVIDVDLKYDTSGTLWQQYQEEIKELLPLLYIVKTKSGGYHLYYRCEAPEGNQKLAMRPATAGEIKENPNEKVKVLIETRGEGGYVIAPPTPGYEKKSEFVIPILTCDQRDHLLMAARSLNQFVEEVRPSPVIARSATSYQKTPWDDYNERCDLVALLESHGWKFVEKKGPRVLLRRPGDTDQHSSGDYHTDMNLFKVFSSSTQFELGKGYKPFAVYALLAHNNDFSAAAKELIAQGYGERGRQGKFYDKILKSLGSGATRQEISKTLVTEEGLSEKDARRIIDEVEDQNGPELLTFWEVVHTRQVKKITIIREKLIRFLYDNGFHLFFYDKHSKIYRIVQQSGGFVQDVTFETMKKFVKEYVYGLPDKFDGITPPELMEVILKGADTYFGKGLIEFVDARDIDILRDDPAAAYFTFTNGVVKVTSEGATLMSYGEIGKPVWRSQVIDFKVDVDNYFNVEECEFYRFIDKVTASDDNSRYLTTLIGYLLHRYKDPARPHAVILAEETEDEKKGGGTGKGILVKALTYMANLERVDGKNFKLDKNFAFQRVGLDTKIVAIEDVRKNVDFEGFYSIITEGMTIERKNKDEFFIPYKDSPKIVFTTNYTIASAGSHGKRRQKVFEFSNYFSASYTPIDEFKHKLFDDWDADEWNRFYNLMFTCVAAYLRDGIYHVANSEKLSRKHIRLNYTPEFIDWWDDYIGNGAGDYKPFRDMYAGFLNANNLERKDYSTKRFRAAIDESCDKFGYQLFTNRNAQDRLVQYKVTRL